jgi:DNA-binding transcriptional ArsR family regulator
MPEADVQALLAFFKAMANESRLRIVGLLAERERSVQELAELLDLKEPTVSHHLAVLKELGVVTSRPEGVVRWHALKPDAMAEIAKSMFENKDMSALTAPVPSKDERDIAPFLKEDGSLTRLPSSRRKRWLIYQRLIGDFAEGRRYPEPEVNQVLQRYHWDCATIRREMIGWRMLARENGVYWRQPQAEWQSP